MMEFGQAVAAGLVGEKLKIELFEARKEEWENLLHTFPEKWEKLVKAAEALAANAGHSPIYDPLALQSFPSTYTVNMRGRGHISVFFTAATSVYALVKGIGYVTLACKAGWNTLDVTDFSELALPAGTSPGVPALFLYADTNLGDAVGVL